MKFMYDLTDKLMEFIVNCQLEEINIGCSFSQVVKIQKGVCTYFLKIAKKGTITSEYEKLKWLDNRLNVPKVIMYDTTNEAEFLLTEKVQGEMLCSDYYMIHKDIGIKVLASAFRKIYSININDCPFDVSINYKLKLVENNINKSIIKIEDVSHETLERFGSLDNILIFLKENKFESELYFSHGDTSLPNIFAVGDKLTGFIDVGECGISDKWFDLAICEKSIKRNYGVEYIDKFYQELNIIPDREKIDYYLLLMEICP